MAEDKKPTTVGRKEVSDGHRLPDKDWAEVVRKAAQYREESDESETE